MRSDPDGRAPGEPPNGDFVAYLESIERAQLAAMKQPHALAHPLPQGGTQVGRATGSRQSTGAAGGQLSRDESRALVDRLRAQGMTLSLTTGSLVMMFIGAIALANALFGDGGLIAFVIGIALLWVPVRRLIASARALAAASAPRPKDTMDAVFGRSGGAHGGGTTAKPHR